MAGSDPPDGQGERRPRRPAASALVVEDFRSVRRWLSIIGVLAVVGTGLAAYAVVRASGSAESDRVAALDRRLTSLERKASEESDVARLQRELRGTSRKSEVNAVDRRVNRLQREVVDATKTAAAADKGSKTLEARLGRIRVQVERLRRRRR